MSYKNKKIIAIIPARGGSKGIPKKNIKILNGMPLIYYTIKHALNSSYIDEVYVSTDDKEIKRVSLKYGAKIIKRPKELATDTASTESALLHAAKVLKENFDFMVLLQCTLPLRHNYDIDNAIKKIIDEKKDSLLSGYENDRFLWENKGTSLTYDYRKRPRRQDKEWEFAENGSIYITKKEILLKEKCRLGGKIAQYFMPKWMSFEADEPFDFQLIEFLMREKLNKQEIRNILKENIKKIKLVLFDVDGVFTDGSIYLDKNGRETMKFSRLDGKGIELLRNKGYVLGLISAEESKIVRERASKLRINEVHLGIKEKLKTYNAIKSKYRLKDEEICYCGDDVQDMPILKLVGLPCCPINSQDDVKSLCKYNSSFSGGNGFIRDVCNLLLVR